MMVEGKEVERKPGDTHENQNSKKSKEYVPYYKLFTFSDSVDYVLTVVGAVAAVANGLSLPVMTVLFNDLIDTFGKTLDRHMVHEVSKVSNPS